MSDEEKKAIEYLKIEYEKLMKEDNILFPLYKSDAKRLIDIIEKQFKEIEELKNADLTTVYLNGFYDGEKKVKDKIKAKIEEQDKIIKTGGIDFNTKSYARCKKEVLQSLLEKE